jgi:hypothetical protein
MRLLQQQEKDVPSLVAAVADDIGAYCSSEGLYHLVHDKTISQPDGSSLTWMDNMEKTCGTKFGNEKCMVYLRGDNQCRHLWGTYWEMNPPQFKHFRHADLPTPINEQGTILNSIPFGSKEFTLWAMHHILKTKISDADRLMEVYRNNGVPGNRELFTRIFVECVQHTLTHHFMLVDPDSGDTVGCGEQFTSKILQCVGELIDQPVPAADSSSIADKITRLRLTSPQSAGGLGVIDFNKEFILRSRVAQAIMAIPEFISRTVCINGSVSVRRGCGPNFFQAILGVDSFNHDKLATRWVTFVEQTELGKWLRTGWKYLQQEAGCPQSGPLSADWKSMGTTGLTPNVFLPTSVQKQLGKNQWGRRALAVKKRAAQHCRMAPIRDMNDGDYRSARGLITQPSKVPLFDTYTETGDRYIPLPNDLYLTAVSDLLNAPNPHLRRLLRNGMGPSMVRLIGQKRGHPRLIEKSEYTRRCTLQDVTAPDLLTAADACTVFADNVRNHTSLAGYRTIRHNAILKEVAQILSETKLTVSFNDTEVFKRVGESNAAIIPDCVINHFPRVTIDNENKEVGMAGDSTETSIVDVKALSGPDVKGYNELPDNAVIATRGVDKRTEYELADWKRSVKDFATVSHMDVYICTVGHNSELATLFCEFLERVAVIQACELHEDDPDRQGTRYTTYRTLVRQYITRISKVALRMHAMTLQSWIRRSELGVTEIALYMNRNPESLTFNDSSAIIMKQWRATARAIMAATTGPHTRQRQDGNGSGEIEQSAVIGASGGRRRLPPRHQRQMRRQIQTCSICRRSGHNRTTCPTEPNPISNESDGGEGGAFNHDSQESEPHHQQNTSPLLVDEGVVGEGGGNPSGTGNGTPQSGQLHRSDRAHSLRRQLLATSAADGRTRDTSAHRGSGSPRSSLRLSSVRTWPQSREALLQHHTSVRLERPEARMARLRLQASVQRITGVLNAPALRESGAGAGLRTAGRNGSSARPAPGAAEQQCAGE